MTYISRCVILQIITCMRSHRHLIMYWFFQVEVLVPPAVQPMPRAGIVRTRKGKNVTLRCAGKGNPNPRISWSKQV